MGMSGRGMADGPTMMDREGPQDMMQEMMGEVLPPGIDPALLPDSQSQGGLLLTRYCSQCHNLPGPGLHTAEEWPVVEERMNLRMQMMSRSNMMGIDAPDNSEMQAILGYLQENAQKPIDLTQYDDLDTSAGRAFQATCSVCHAIPDPQLHTSVEWPVVVERMKQNMVILGKTVPNEATIREIVGYLQRHAKDSD